MASATEGLKIDPFEIFDSRWGLLTAGTADDFNSMTISWGALGTLWGAPGQRRSLATVYVRSNRHTFGYLERNELFTVSFLPEDFRGALMLMGQKSGRDTDKVAESGLTPVELAPGAMSYEEADLVLVCRKLYHQAMEIDLMPPAIAEQLYTGIGEPAHHMFIGDIIDVRQQ